MFGGLTHKEKSLAKVWLKEKLQVKLISNEAIFFRITKLS